VAGHRIEAASLVEATTLRAPLFLRRTGPVADLTLEWRLVTAGGQVIFSQPYEPFDGRFPFGDWEPRTIYGDRIELALPRRLPQGPLELRLHDARTNEFTTLARLPAETRQRDSARPDLAAYRPIGAVFNQEVELVAARIAGSNAATIVTPPTTLPIGVAWRAVTDPTSSLRMFVHVLDASGQLVAQADRLPRGGAEPTTSWVAGQWITDDFGLDVSGLGPGRYQLVTGMSDLGRGRRADITTPAGSGSTIPLGTLEIR
jgi:hypothetical protein